ncbi:MAG: CerR family C-terminal domain-containing protein [Deltaproteobacteria bacterium]|nr:CerR family C-terminal domain-containing protein [Deltaproteobacteria bacterium]
MKENGKSEITKKRLLAKAEMLFSQKGYHAVSVREITAAAKCNMGAVNYHFNSKRNLYMEVFRSRWVPLELRMYESFKQALDGLESPGPATVIHALGMAFLEAPLSEEGLRSHRQLMIREINNPTEAFEYVAEHAMRPLFEYLQEHLKRFLPDHLDEEDLTLDIMSIFGMVLYFNYSRPMISRITGRKYDYTFKTRLIDQLVRFSIEGLGVNGKDRKD